MNRRRRLLCPAICLPVLALAASAGCSSGETGTDVPASGRAVRTDIKVQKTPAKSPLATTPAGYSVMHSFVGATDGQYPQGVAPILLNPSNNTLYGITYSGGANSNGTIWSINTSGANFSVVFSFPTPATQGRLPYYLTSDPYSDTTLYGITGSGGANSSGTVFKLSVATTPATFTTLYTFPASSAPAAALVAYDGTLWGLTEAGGTSSKGTLWTMSESGTGYTVLHNFGATASDSSSPATLMGYGSPIVLWGTASFGGSSGYGTIFSYATSGSTYTSPAFSFTSTDGYSVYPTQVAFVNPATPTTLIGATGNNSPTASTGTIYTVGTNGTGYTVLRSLAGGTDCEAPDYGLLSWGSLWFSTCEQGAANGGGAVYQIDATGNHYALAYSFGSATGDGTMPLSPLSLGAVSSTGTQIFGTTYEGGTSSAGTIFSFLAPTYTVTMTTTGTGSVSCSTNNTAAGTVTSSTVLAGLWPGNTFSCTATAGSGAEIVSMIDENDATGASTNVTSALKSGTYSGPASYENHTITTTFGLVQGQSCTQASECANSLCANGYCCNTACNAGPCEACNVANKLGTCSPVLSGTVCSDAGGPCELASTCDGVDPTCPANTFLSPSAQCAPAECEPGNLGAPAVYCDGTHAACPAQTPVSCGDYVCSASSGCLTSCSSSSECSTGYACDAPSCAPIPDAGPDSGADASHGGSLDGGGDGAAGDGAAGDGGALDGGSATGHDAGVTDSGSLDASTGGHADAAVDATAADASQDASTSDAGGSGSSIDGGEAEGGEGDDGGSLSGDGGDDGSVPRPTTGIFCAVHALPTSDASSRAPLAVFGMIVALGARRRGRRRGKQVASG